MTPEIATPFLPHHNKMWTLNLEPIYTVKFQSDSEIHEILPQGRELPDLRAIRYDSIPRGTVAPSTTVVSSVRKGTGCL
ncbi:hypothetical protein TNCV_1100921 [Trichonephila clavipes]|nr:hypothetical protein TNCV_1100921 [Trichonephila clavipes]